MAPSCHFYARGNCRNGEACRFSHTEAKEDKVVDRDVINSLSDANRFLRTINKHRNADVVLEKVHLLRDKLNGYIRDLAQAELRILFEVLGRCSEAFDRPAYEEVLRCVSANVIMSIPPFVNQLMSPVGLVSCMRVLVEVGRVDPVAAALVPVELLASRADALACTEEMTEVPLRQIQFYKNGGALKNFRASRDRRRPAELAPDEQHEYEDLMAEGQLMPSLEEITDEGAPPEGLRKLKNREAEKWESSSAAELLLYRATHYYCLRQEFLVPLKEALVHSLGLVTDSGIPPKAMCYSHVKALKQPFGVSGTTEAFIQVHFVCPRPVDFTLGRHLIYGSLVALFRTSTGTPFGEPDSESRIYATVENFDLRRTGGTRSNSGTVGLAFDDDNFRRFQFDAEYCMLESPDYFMAKRPVFDFLRDEDLLRGMPLLSGVLGTVEPSVDPPPYLMAAKVDLSPLYAGAGEGSVVADPLAPWPKLTGKPIELDAAQEEAMKHILKTPVAIVQGPPGTGKSYLGEKSARIARGVLDFKHYEEPILAVTLTNHALDQFLVDLLHVVPHMMKGQIVRFGGRSQTENEELQRCHSAAVQVQGDSRGVHEAKVQVPGQVARHQAFNFELCLSNCVALYQGGDAQQLCALAYMPFSLFRKILRPPGWKTSFSKLGFHPAEFALLALRAWLEDDEGELARSEKELLQRWGIRMDDNRRTFGALPEEARRGLLQMMVSGADGEVRRLFEHAIPEPEEDDDEEEEVDMDRIRLIEGERHFDDLAGVEEMQDEQGEQVDEEAPVVEGPMERPSSNDCDSVRIGADWKSDFSMAAVLQRRIRSKLEESLNANIVAAACHNSVHDAGMRVVRRGSRRNKRGVLEAVGAALEGPMKVRLHQLYADGREMAKSYAQQRKALALRACRGAKLVGMTSTYAALNRDLLHRVGPRVVVIEEAGELLECQLVASLSSPNLQHLVLIGDHQQLRPKVNVYELTKKNHFDISLFERLINVGVPFARLTTQLRMRPEVSQLVQHFYVDGLIDHERVKVYDRVGGVSKDVFFMDHREREQAFEGTSKRNEFEARYAAKLALYLVRTQQYNAEDITLLTPYIGQKRLIRNSLDADLRRSPDGVKAGARVVTIDDYQGEENKIVILSLVRSNKARKIGFTGIENRVIVAMSRAKEGLYIIGNSEMFGNALSWEAIICKLRAQMRIGPALTLQCRVHPEQLEQVAMPEDFIHVKDGGCRLPCRRLLDRCGHRCPLNCHVFDHEQVCCDKPCNRARPAGCGHRCIHLCWECTRSKSTPEDPCPTPCATLVPVTLACGHTKRVRCHYRGDEVELRCHTQVIVKLPCGHDLRTSCYKSRRPVIELSCEFTRKVRLGRCGHEVTQKCHDVPKCGHRCDEQLSCGHPCPKKCYPAHTHDGVKCEEACEETLACGHFCDEKCGQPHTRLCQEECGLQCLHGHTCGKPCYEFCVPCREKCPWKCPHHRCKKLCFEPCDRPRCDQACPLKLECAHACQGLCGEPCPLCPVCYHDVTCGISFEEIGSAREDDARIYTLPECGHTFYLDSLDQYMDYNPTRGEHQAIQLRACPVCREPIFTAPRYGNVIKAQVSLVAKVKEKLIAATRELTLRERLEVNAAMQSERGVLGAAAGHWYACPNGHPYFIADCGGANQVTRCPDCGASIGGTGYRIERGNRFMADFTGEGARPQWPNQGE